MVTLIIKLYNLKIKSVFLEKLELCEVLFVEQNYYKVNSYFPERLKIEILM